MSRTETRIGLLHHVGGGNLGDEATLETIASNIKQRWPIAEIVAFSMNPDDTEARHGIKSYPLRRKRWGIGYRPVETKATFKEDMKALARKHKAIFYLLAMVRLPSEAFRELSFLVSSRRKVKSLDLLIVSGGGQLTGRDGPWGFPYTILKWIVLARSAGVRCIFLNVGAGPLSHPLAKFFARRALFSAEYVSLRDNKSQALVREIGFTGESRVFPDSVYSLESAATNANPPEQGSRPIVGFAPMPYPDQGGAPTERDQILYNAFIVKLAGFGSWLASQSYALTLFGTDIGVDPQAIKDLQKTLQDQEVICSPQYGINYPVESVRDLLATMSGLDYVVTCRFHGVVFAHLLNKPVLAIAHHPKVAELMSDLELSAYCVDIRDFDPNLLAERFALMVARTEEIKARMAARLTGNRQLLRRQFDELFRL
jgi:polysaccharide pyruvyl transferase WcaK-like protein